MFSLRGKYGSFYILRGIWYYFQVTRLEPYYTTSARGFALNVRSHLVLSVGRRKDGGGFIVTKDMRENKKKQQQEIRLEFNRNLIGEATLVSTTFSTVGHTREL